MSAPIISLPTVSLVDGKRITLEQLKAEIDRIANVLYETTVDALIAAAVQAEWNIYTSFTDGQTATPVGEVFSFFNTDADVLAFYRREASSSSFLGAIEGVDSITTLVQQAQAARDAAATTATSVAAILAGRNVIVNGSGRVNQRNYVSGAAVAAANQFTLDRWFVSTVGQSLAFTGSAAGRTMTAPAGGVSQVIEGANIVGGTYVLNWTGTATATVNGVARAKGATFTLAANTNAIVRFADGTFTNVQVELAALPTTFERLDIGTELNRCQRYYETGSLWMQTSSSPGSFGSSLQFSATKRTLPTMLGAAISSSFTTSVAFQAISATGFGISATPSASGAFVTWGWTATAELTA